MHGEADDNSGTFPIQSERLYMALKGHGAIVRYVTLPYEAHGYAARETLLHVLAERLNWFDKYVKNAGPKTPTDASASVAGRHLRRSPATAHHEERRATKNTKIWICAIHPRGLRGSS